MIELMDSAFYFVLSREFEAQIRTYEGEDPLDIWYRYVHDHERYNVVYYHTPLHVHRVRNTSLPDDPFF